MKKSLVLIGGGGHCKSCIDVIEETEAFKIEGIVDKKENLNGKILGYPIIATDNDLPMLVKEYDNFLITIGQIKSPEKRIELFEKLKTMGAHLPVIVSPKAHVSKYALICEGTIVMHHALVNAGAVIGKNCIINTKVLVEHDANIGDHCHIATAAVINGGVKVGSRTFVGSQVMTREYIEIGENSIIGGNLSILGNIEKDSFIR